MVVSWIRRGSNHLFVARVDLAARRFVHVGRVEVVGEVTSNRILRHCLLLEWSSGKLVALPSLYSRLEDRKSTATPFFISTADMYPRLGRATEPRSSLPRALIFFRGTDPGPLCRTFPPMSSC